MVGYRGEALVAARKLLRTFASAPEPRAQANRIFSELAHAEGWTKAQEAEIARFGAWLTDRPPLAELKARSEQVLARLS